MTSRVYEERKKVYTFETPTHLARVILTYLPMGGNIVVGKYFRKNLSDKLFGVHQFSFGIMKTFRRENDVRVLRVWRARTCVCIIGKFSIM